MFKGTEKEKHENHKKAQNEPIKGTQRDRSVGGGDKKATCNKEHGINI